MNIEVRIFSCYENTYKCRCNDILKILYPNINMEDVKVKVDDISYIGKGTVQSQRSSKKYVTRTIRIYEDGVLCHIIGLSNTNYDLDKLKEKERYPNKKYVYGKKDYHANTYLKQGSAGIFNFYFDEKAKNKNVDLSFYLLDTDETYPHDLFNVLSYRELQTIGFRILNIDEIDFRTYNYETGSTITTGSNIAFSSFNKYMNDIYKISMKNKGNLPSFLKCEEHLVCGSEDEESYYTDKYIYTFKALSAQGYDSLFRTWCMKVLADREGTEIEFRLGKQYFNYDAEEKSVSDKLTGPIEKTFENAGVKINYIKNDEFLREKNLEEDAYLKAKQRKDPRNQTLFRNSIRKKGVPTACIICGKDDPSVLKAAHIWDVSSIKRAAANEINNFISINNLQDLIDKTSIHKGELFFKKYCLTNSGDNGIWLCANHHDQFDRNYFCFDSEYGTVLLHFADEEQKDSFMRELKAGGSIPQGVLTRATKAFLAQRKIGIGW